MILYYAPGACSLACHIAMVEAGLSHRLVKVGRDRRTEDGQDFNTVNAKGYTPALDLGDGTILTENLAILAYIAEASGQLLAKEGLARWRALEATAFMTSEIHTQFKPFFRPESTPSEKDKAGQVRFGSIDALLGDKAFLVGEQMTIADAYLFVMLTWAGTMCMTVSTRLADYLARMKERPSIIKALREEGLS